MSKLVHIYTDGACSGNQNEENIGGFGAVLEFSGIEKEIFGGEDNTTNNRMELRALIEALHSLKEEGLCLQIFSDSSYVINCFKNKWYESWEKNGWKNSKKQSVENQDLWEELLKEVRKHTCNFYLVKGHVKTPSKEHYMQLIKNNGVDFSFEQFEKIIEYNNRCDALANVYIAEHR